MINPRSLKHIDELINKINNIPVEELKTVDIHYLQCRRNNKYMYIMGQYDGSYMTRLSQFTSYFDKLYYPNTLFKIFTFLVIDLEQYSLLTYRFYAFPYYHDIYKLAYRKGINKSAFDFYIDTINSIEKTPLQITWTSKFTLDSHIFDVKMPEWKNDYLNSYFNVDIEKEITMNWEIDYFIANYIENDTLISDPFFHPSPISKEYLIDSISCSCVDDQSSLTLACNNCNNAEDRASCSELHGKKCSCGKWTYYRSHNCLKCHIMYSKAKYIDGKFDDRGNFKEHLFSKVRSLKNYLPISHHYSDSRGLCIGNGHDDINRMLQYELNPLKLIMSFKSNASYSNHDSLLSYYDMYTQKIDKKIVDDHGEFYNQLNHVYNLVDGQNKKIYTSHVFSLRCFCPQCFFYRVLLYHENIELDTRGFVSDQPPIITRSHFIKIYKKYLEVYHKSKAYRETYIHKIIKIIVNTPFQNWLVA